MADQYRHAVWKENFIVKCVSGVLRPVIALEETAWLSTAPILPNLRHAHKTIQDGHIRTSYPISTLERKPPP